MAWNSVFRDQTYNPVSCSRGMNRRAATIAMCTLMVVSTAPLTNAEGQEESSIWGITYDWSHFEGDAFNITGVDVNDLNADLSAAAEYAGFDMDYDEVLSGTTQIFVESWDEAGPFTVTTEDGSSHQVGKRITELTVRHGVWRTQAWPQTGPMGREDRGG